jgi:hypothetical protein
MSRNITTMKKYFHSFRKTFNNPVGNLRKLSICLTLFFDGVRRINLATIRRGRSQNPLLNTLLGLAEVTKWYSNLLSYLEVSIVFTGHTTKDLTQTLIPQSLN